MRGVRIRLEGWEGQCETCRQWWPLDEEFWARAHGLRSCLACKREERRVYVADLRARDPEMRARHREASRENQALKRGLNHDAYLEYQRRWFAAHHVRINAERAERYLIENELAGRAFRRKTSRDETPETLAIRAEYRRKWVADNGPIVIQRPLRRSVDEQRAYKRDWMRRKRAAGKAA